MIFDVAHLIWYLSQYMVLEPGDVINTGTPAGVALGMPDHPYLRAGNIVELEIDGLGRQRQTFARPDGPARTRKEPLCPHQRHGSPPSTPTTSASPPRASSTAPTR